MSVARDPSRFDLAPSTVDSGLKDDLVLGYPNALRFVLWGGKLKHVPSKPADLPFFNLMSFTGKLRAGFGAIGIRRPAPGHEESVEDFVRRNLGDEVFERYNVKLRVLVSCGKEAEADELMEELKRKGLKPNVFSFNALMKAYCENGNLEEAKKIYSNMLKNGCTPNRLSFEIIIPSLCKNGEMDLAFKLSKDSISKACYIDIDVLQGVVDGLFKESKMEEAKNFVSSYKNGLKLPSSEKSD